MGKVHDEKLCHEDFTGRGLVWLCKYQNSCFFWNYSLKKVSIMQIILHNICTWFRGFFRRSDILADITSTVQVFQLGFCCSFSFCSDVMTSGIDILGQKASSVFHMKYHNLGF